MYEADWQRVRALRDYKGVQDSKTIDQRSLSRLPLPGVDRERHSASSVHYSASSVHYSASSVHYSRVVERAKGGSDRVVESQRPCVERQKRSCICLHAFKDMPP